ncbi:hypothetical protein [Leucobacter sp. GX24907]
MSDPSPLAQVDWGATIQALITGVVGLTVGALTARGKRREDTQTLIDQLQEERSAYVEQLREERAAGDTRLDRMWVDKAASRQHVADLRSHINQGLGPPPPGPPAGYIE